MREYPYALDIFKNELLAHKEELQKTGYSFSFTTDPLLPETERLTRQAVGVCQRHGVPVKILSKCAVEPDFAEASEGLGRRPYRFGRNVDRLRRIGAERRPKYDAG